MTPERWHRIESLLEEALELSLAEREAYLDRACGDDVALRQEVDSLIEADGRAGKFIARPLLARGRATGTTIKQPFGPVPAVASDSERRHGAVARKEADESLYPSGAMLAGRYRIVSFLGRGGMGEVYRADDLELDQAVALKFLTEPMERDPASLPRLQAEVRIARRISHPNVCRVHDIGEADGRHFLSMEYIEGEDLASLLRRIGRLPKDKALEIAQQICQGLAAAHGQNVLHRDLKPSNLMIDSQGQARITDFGIAVRADRVLVGDERRGTPIYMAPEQIAGEVVTIQSDLYALGLVLYELFTGRQAMRAGSITELIRQQQEASFEPPSRWVPGLDPAIEEAILSCIERQAHDRPESAEAVAGALAAHTTDLEWLPAPGRAIPHRSSWVLEKKLGAGGFGEVWLVRHLKTRDRRVFKLGRGTEGRRTLEREIAVFRLLKTRLGVRDDIVRILDWSLDEPPYFIESEYTEGGDLLEWAAEQGGIDRVPLEIRLEIVAQVATALAAAHSVGVLHKDVKPTNVLISHDQEPKASAGQIRAQLIDFGLGAVTESQRLVEAGITLPRSALIGPTDESAGGTRLYMAPELVEGKAATLQSDVYALGVVLFQVVVGDFSRALASGWGRDVDDELLREDIADAVDGAAERRLADARELARRLRSLHDRRASRAREQRSREAAEQTRKALARSHRRRRLTVAVTLVLAVVALALGVLASLIAGERQRAEHEAARARNIARIAVAGEWLHKDPTKAARVLLEVEDPGATPYAVSQMRQVLSRRLAMVELGGHEQPIQTATWSPRGDRIVTTSMAGTARVWRVDGGEPVVLDPASADGRVEPLLNAWLVPGDERIVTLSGKGTARAWNANGGGGTVIFEGLDSSLQVAAISPAGDRVVTGSWAGAVRLWHLGTSGEPIQLGNHDGPVTAVAFAPREDRIVTASQDGTARVWSVDGSAAPVELRHDRALRSASFGPRGDRILTVCTEGKVRVWRLSGSDEPMVFEVDGESVVASWSPDGERIVIGSSRQRRADGQWGAAWVWRADGSGKPVILEGDDDAVVAAFSPVGDKVLVVSGYGTARLWSADGVGKPVVLMGHHGIVKAAFDPSGERVLTVSREGTVRVWDVVRPMEPAVFEHSEAIRHASWNPVGNRIVTVPRNGAARVWRGDGTGEPMLLEGHRDAVLAASWSPRDERLVTASGDGTARVWRLDALDRPIVLEGHTGRVLAASWSPGAERVVTASSDGTARVWKADGSGEPVVLRPQGGAVIAARWSPRGDRVVTVTADDTATLLWHPDGTGDPILLEGHEAPVEIVAFGPRGDRILTASGDGTARVWNTDGTGDPIVLPGHEDFIFAAAFAPTGERIVTSTVGGTVRLWNVGAPGRSIELSGHRGAVNAASWSPRGDRFVTVSEDGTARVWRTEGTLEPMVLEGHAGPVVAASWSPRGDRILTASRDGTARVWKIDTSDLIAAIEAATRVCLLSEFREQNLGESPEEARRRYRACALAMAELKP